MHVRCPHCHNPIEFVADSALANLSCPSCGSQFSLISGETTGLHEPGLRTLGHFELLEQVGSGAFGSVWKARDSQLDRIVAVKIPRQGQLGAAESELFFREARAAAQVRHANIVPVHEIGREQGTIFIVSDFVDGANLKEWLSAQRLTPRETANLCLKIAEALHTAHERGIVHRDLKPGNIMVDAGGEPHITDFGLAKREAGEITMTVEGRILGTPAYMSPEQARGKAHEADRRADIYSLGVILFELLTGELPFRGDERMLIVQILRDEPPRPRKLASHVPRDLETICLKCLEKDPHRRYGTALALADDLRRYLNGHAIHARQIGSAERLWRTAKRNKAAAILTVSLLSVLIGVAAGSTWAAVSFAALAGNLQESLGREGRARKLAEQALAREEQVGMDAQRARELKKEVALLQGELTKAREQEAERLLQLSLLQGELAKAGATTVAAENGPVPSNSQAEEALRIGDHGAYSVSADLPNSPQVKSIKNDAASRLTLYRNKIALIRVVVEDPESDSAILVEGGDGVCLLSRGGHGWIDTIRSGDTIAVAFDAANYQGGEQQIELATLRHSTLVLPVRFQEGEVLECGTVKLHKAPADQLGQLVLEFEPEPGLHVGDGTLTVGPGDFFSGLTVPIAFGEGGKPKPVSVGAGTYHVQARSTGKFASRKHTDVKVAAAEPTVIKLPVFRQRNIQVQWRFRLKDATDWKDGTATFASGEIWRPASEWQSGGYPYVRVSDWNGSACNLSASNCNLAHLAESPWPPPDEILEARSSPSSRDEVPVKAGDAYFMWTTDWQAVFQVKDVSPVVSTESSSRVQAEVAKPRADVPVDEAWRIGKHDSYSLAADFPDSPKVKSIKNEAASRLKRYGNMISLIRLAVEDPDSDSTILVEGGDGVCFPRGGGHGWIDTVRSGDTIAVAFDAANFRGGQPQIELATLRHSTLVLPIRFEEGEVLECGTVTLHKLPAEQLGQVALEFQPEQGLHIADGELIIGPDDFYSGLALPLPIGEDGKVAPVSVAAGTYRVQVKSAGKFVSSKQSEVKVATGASTVVKLPVFRQRSLQVQWRFRLKDASDWKEGTATIVSGDYWAPATEWGSPGYPFVEVSDWNGSACTLAASNCNFARLGASAWPPPDEILKEPLSSRDEVPAKAGDAYAMWTTGWQAVFQIKDISPVVAKDSP